MTTSSRSFGPRFLLAAFGPVVFASLVQAAQSDDAAQDRDAKAIKKFLSEPSHKTWTWEAGPTRLTNKAIEKTYPGMRFYYVFSSLDTQKKDKSKVSLVMEVNEKGEAGLISFRTGQIKTNGVEDVKAVAAALMSLHLTPRGPVSIEANEVQPGWDLKGWKCQAKKDGYLFHASLFNYHDGHYDSITWADPNPGKPKSRP